jgi:signal transduction histidine kinase
MPRRERTGLDGHLVRCRDVSDTVHSDLTIERRDGETVDVRLYSRRAPLARSVLVPTVIMDISELVQLERARLAAEREWSRADGERRLARAADRAKDRLIAMVSHELRNPLSPALIASATLARWTGLPEPAREMAAIIKRNIELEARLIDDLLDVSRVTQGRLDLRLEPVDVHDVIRQSAESCGAAAQARNIAIDLALHAPRHHASADSTRLGQVFWNLMHNAIKFSRPGGRIHVETSTDREGVLNVAVRDEGVGMDPEALARLFQPFEGQGERSSGGTGLGLGLGLSIARGIVDAHGGRIRAASDGPGLGATLEVELATCEPSGEPAGPQPSHAGALAGAGRTPAAASRVLIVEDHADTASMLASFLTQHGHVVRVAPTLADALRLIDQPWDAVISDIKLPDGSGLDVARRINGRQRPSLMVTLSGFGASADVAASREAGFDAHLVKPVDLNQLLTLLG